MTGRYLLANIGYQPQTHAPCLTLLPEGAQKFIQFEPVAKTLTLQFEPEQRFCTGWHDLAEARNYPCPNQTTTESNYHECRPCQLKTGFNPAFYHTDAVSPQQQARNQQPHNVYLAHFGPKVIKVGISWAGRGLQRLLDQGARSAIVIKQFPTAHEARHYEATIARLPEIAETLQSRTKKLLLKKTYDRTAARQELNLALDTIINHTGLQITMPEVLHLDDYYLSHVTLQPAQLIDNSNQHYISGMCRGMIGNNLIVEQQDNQFLYSLQPRRGFKVTLSNIEVPNQFEPQQVSLF